MKTFKEMARNPGKELDKAGKTRKQAYNWRHKKSKEPEPPASEEEKAKRRAIIRARIKAKKK